MKSNKINFILITISVLFFLILNAWQGSYLIGKTFSGFGVGVLLNISPVSDRSWTGYNSKAYTYSRILSVDGIKIHSVKQLEDIVQAKLPGTLVTYEIQYKGITDKIKIKTMEFSEAIFLQTFFVNFIVSLFYLFIGVFIMYYYKPNDNKINFLLMFVLLFSVSSVNFHDQEFNHNTVPLGYFIQIMTVLSLVQLGIFINKNNISNKTFNILSSTNIISGTILSLLLIVFSSILQNDIYLYPLIYKIYFSLFNFLVIYVALSFLSFAVSILYSYIKSPINSLEKMQNRVILTGSLLSFSPYLLLWFVPTIFGYAAPLNVAMVSFIGLPIFITYSIVKYGAFDIEVFIRKGLIYTALSSVVILGYFSVSTLSFLLLKNVLNLNQDVYIAASAIIATLIASSMKQVIQNSIDKAFYRHKLDLNLLLEEFINEIINVFDKRDLLNTSIFYLEKTVNPLFVGLYLSDKSNSKMQLLGASNGVLPPEVNLNPSMLSSYSEKKLSNKDTDLLKKDAMNIDNAMLIPLQKDKDTLGVLVIGNKKSELDYFYDEKNFLKNFTTGLSMALNSLILKEETIDLAVKNRELETKAEFLRQLTSNLSHDLKFPLSSAYSIVNKIKYIIEKKNTVTKEFVQENVEDLTKSLKKIGEYISISTDRELISLGKLVLKNEEVDIKQACRDAIFLHSDHLDKKGIELSCELPEDEITVLGDKIRLESVISNLISNAIKYGNDKIYVNMNFNAKGLFIEVKDNGNGISESIKNNVFDSYVKGNNIEASGNERSTGLGLFICKNYVEMMNGNIWFETIENKGTSFFIKLPAFIKDTNIIEDKYNNSEEIFVK